MNKQKTGVQPRSKHVLGLVQVALFAALIIIMAFTPFLGYIPLGFTNATTIHIPVIIGAILLGPKKGGILGFVFGLTSLIRSTMTPTPTSFVFSPFYSLGEIHGGFQSLIICFIPRILIGVVPYYVYHFFAKITGKWKSSRAFSLGIAGVAGSLTNTLLVMGMILLFFKDAYAAVNEVSVEAVYTLIAGVIAVNGVPEAIIAAIIVSFAGKVLLRSKYFRGR